MAAQLGARVARAGRVVGLAVAAVVTVATLLILFVMWKYTHDRDTAKAAAAQSVAASAHRYGRLIRDELAAGPVTVERLLALRDGAWRQTKNDSYLPGINHVGASPSARRVTVTFDVHHGYGGGYGGVQDVVIAYRCDFARVDDRVRSTFAEIRPDQLLPSLLPQSQLVLRV